MTTAHDILADLIMQKTAAHFAALWPNGDVEVMAREGNHEVWFATVIFHPAAGYTMCATYGYSIGSDDQGPMRFRLLAMHARRMPEWPEDFAISLTDEEWATVAGLE